MEHVLNKTELISREEVAALHLRQLKAQVGYLSTHSPYYRRVLAEGHITADDIRSLDDLKRLPFIDKYIVGESQQRVPPFGEFLCVPEKEIVKYFRTSGTTLEPRNFAYTWSDWWDVVCETLVRMLYSCGVRADDRVFIAFPYSTFIALWTSHYAAEKLGCMVIPGGGASTIERLRMMQQMKVTVLCATPTYAQYLVTAALKEGIDIRKIPMRVIHTGGEPLAAVPGSRERIEETWHAKAYDQYGCSESTCPGAGECHVQEGLHCTENVFIVEVLDEDGLQVPPGRHGELVLSNVVSKTMPLLRFKTGDIVTYTDDPCSCGRQSIRIKVIGRTDDMIVVKGTNVFPSAVEEIVKRCDELSDHFMIVIDEVEGQYELVLQVEASAALNANQEKQVRQKLTALFRENLRFKPIVQFREPGSLPRFEVKAKRVIDRRNMS